MNKEFPKGLKLPPKRMLKVPAEKPAVTEEWYYCDADGNELGPISRADIKKVIKPSTLVWKPGMKDWCKAMETNLFAPSGCDAGKQIRRVAKPAVTREQLIEEGRNIERKHQWKKGIIVWLVAIGVCAVIGGVIGSNFGEIGMGVLGGVWFGVIIIPWVIFGIF